MERGKGRNVSGPDQVREETDVPGDWRKIGSELKRRLNLRTMLSAVCAANCYVCAKNRAETVRNTVARAMPIFTCRLYSRVHRRTEHQLRPLITKMDDVTHM